jgi:transcriptional regulator with XRE-family HTH domain
VDPKELIEKDLAKGETQTGIAAKIGVSNATIYKILYTQTRLTVATLKKVARAYGVPLSSFLVAEEEEQYASLSLTEKEQELVNIFRKLDEVRQDRLLENIKDMILALAELRRRGDTAKDSHESGRTRKPKR